MAKGVSAHARTHIVAHNLKHRSFDPVERQVAQLMSFDTVAGIGVGVAHRTPSLPSGSTGYTEALKGVVRACLAAYHMAGALTELASRHAHQIPPAWIDGMDAPDEAELSIEGQIAQHGLAETIALRGWHRAELEPWVAEEVTAIFAKAGAPQIDDGLEAAIVGMDRSSFFLVMGVLCDLLPRLPIDHRSAMRLTETLVRAAGDDMAAGRPNEALGEWCAAGDEHSTAILSDARSGDALALRHLTTALVAHGDLEAMLEFAVAASVETRRAAASALGRMKARDGSDRAFATLVTLAGSSEEDLALTALAAGFRLQERLHVGPSAELDEALASRLGMITPQTTHAASAFLWLHGETLSPKALDECLKALRHVEPANSGTVTYIDRSASTMERRGVLDRLVELVGDLCDRTDGDIPLSSFPSLLNALMRSGSDALGRAVTYWLWHGSTATRASLSALLSAVGRTAPPFSVPADALPTEPQVQLLLCRKAIGWFHLDPLAAVPIPLAVLRHGSPQIADELLELMFDSLFLNYGGRLVEHVQWEADEGHPYGDALRSLIDRRNALFDNAAGAEAIRELQPTERQRETERLLWTEQMQEGVRKGEEKSVFHGLFSKQYILYGGASLSRVGLPDGSSKFAEIEMQEMSVSAELPFLGIVDPSGLRIRLQNMRFEPMEAQ